LQFYEKSVWVERPTLDGENLLISKYYVPSDFLPNSILKNFSFLDSTFDTTNCLVILSGIPTLSLDRECGLPLSNCRYYAKTKEDAISTAMCNLGLTQSIGTTHCANLLDFEFTNFDNLVGGGCGD
jgi:hypothetical protein